MARFITRELAADDDGPVALAVAAGPHGVYVHNALAAGTGDGVVVARDGRDLALAWLGPRGNLVAMTVADARLAAEVAAPLVAAIGDRLRGWRIAMGPSAVVDRLRERVPGTPLVDRDQVYCTGSAATAARDLVHDDVRPATPADRDRLVQATLQLNASDLNIDPRRVDRRWLRDTIDERIAEGSTRVLGPPGGVRCKLDLGSDGPGGLVLEGVFTFPEHRGQGLASTLVATCLAAARGPVCLHVGKHNLPARAAYARAGMTAAGGCRLLLVG